MKLAQRMVYKRFMEIRRVEPIVRSETKRERRRDEPLKERVSEPQRERLLDVVG